MRISITDYALARFSYRFPTLMKSVSRLESSRLAAELNQIQIRQPTYIGGLARSGSTMLLELMARHPALATHQYRDFPFIAIPCLWSRLRSSLETKAAVQAVERPHQDGIMIEPSSPESMEEPLWQSWFYWIHDCRHIHRLDESHENPAFDQDYSMHLRKIVWLRKKPRYLAKNNYLLTRLRYLHRLLPDAKIIVPIRHPVTHVQSLVTQHRLFTDYALNCSRVPGYLQAAGHFEFGPQRVAIRVDHESAERTEAFWLEGNEHLGYAAQWCAVYTELLQFLRDDKSLSDSVLVIPYEQFCQEPTSTLNEIWEHCELEKKSVDLTHIKPIRDRTKKDLDSEAVWNAAKDVAQFFGYDEDIKSFGSLAP